MPRRSAQRAGTNLRDEGDVGASIVARVVDRAFENPATSGGLMVMALTVTAIISNATFLQGARRSDIAFSPASAPMARAVTSSIPAPSPRPDVSQTTVTAPPLPRLAPVSPAPVAPVAAPAATTANASLVVSVQRELARLGLYSGAIDGKTGSHTAAAIKAYEKAAGQTETGKATPALLAALRAPVAAKPAPATDGQADAIATTAAALDQRERDRAATIAAAEQGQAQTQAQASYRIIQGALDRIGYGPLPIDGTASPATTDAIRRFELDNGLPVTGQASDRLLARLTAIGAVKAN